MNIEYVVMGDRFTDTERRRLRSARCTRQTAYGLPWSEYCTRVIIEDDLRRGSIECDEHERDTEQEHGKVLRLAYILKPADTEAGARVARWDGTQVGTVREVDESTVTVEWDENLTPKIPGNKFTHFLTSALADGTLVKLYK